MPTLADAFKSHAALVVASLALGCQAENPVPEPFLTAPTVSAADAAAGKSEPPALAQPTKVGKPAEQPSGLVYETLTEGTGAQAKSGDVVTIHFTAALVGGKAFDSTRDSNHPVTVELGNKRLIQGWNEGIAGMKVGERRNLTVPSNLAYGALGRLPVIPPNSTTAFEIELLAIGSPPRHLAAQSLGAKFTLPTKAEMDAGQNEWIDGTATTKKKSPP